MTTLHSTNDGASIPAESCSVDRSCPPEAGCCGSTPEPGASPRRTGLWAGFLAAGAGLACVLGCMAVALAAGGGLAAAGGLLAGEIWLVLAGVAVAAISAVVLVRRKGSGSC
jgi:hypothetical protein